MAERFVEDIGEASAQGVITGGVIDRSASSLLEVATEGAVAVQRKHVVGQAQEDVEATNRELADNLSVLSQLRQKYRDSEGTPTEVAKAQAEISKLDAAVRQGLHRPEQADIRKRAIIQRAINTAPLFAQELRGLVKRSDGSIGTSAADEETAILAGLDKAVRKKADELYGAGNWGVKEEENIRARMRRDAEASDLVNISNLEAPRFRSSVMTLVNNAGHDIMVRARSIVQNRGALLQDDVDNINIQLDELQRQSLQTFRQHVSGNMEVSLTDEKVRDIEDGIKSEIDGMRQFLKGKRLGERLKTAEDTRALLAKAQSPLTDEVIRVINLGGESGGMALQQMLFATPQQQKQVASMVGDSGKALLPPEMRADINAMIVRGTEIAIQNVDAVPPGWERLYSFINQKRVKAIYSKPDIDKAEAEADNSAENLIDMVAKSTDIPDLSEVVGFYKMPENRKALELNSKAKAKAVAHAHNLAGGVLRMYTDAVNMPDAEIRIDDDGTVVFLSTNPDPLSVGENTRPVLTQQINTIYTLYDELGLDRNEVIAALQKRSAKKKPEGKTPLATGTIQRDTPAQEPAAPAVQEEPLGTVTGEFDSSDAVQTQGVQEQEAIPRIEGGTFEVQGELTQHKYGKALTDEFELDEGVENRVYKDTKGKRTIGVGFNMDQSSSFRLMKDALGVDRNTFNGIKLGEIELSDDQVQALFSESLAIAEKDIQKVIPNFDEHPEDVQRAMLNFSFNQGLSKLRNTWKRTMQDVANMDYESAADRLEQSPWAKQVQVSRSDRIIKALREAGKAGDDVAPQATLADDVTQIKAAFPDATIDEIKEFIDSRG